VAPRVKTAYRFNTTKFRHCQRDRQDKYSSPLERGDHELSSALPMIENASVEAEIRVLEVPIQNVHR